MGIEREKAYEDLHQAEAEDEAPEHERRERDEAMSAFQRAAPSFWSPVAALLLISAGGDESEMTQSPTLFSLGMVMALSHCGGSEVSPRTAVAPNIILILILADDLGYGDVGSYGSEVIDTPPIDARAAYCSRATTE